MDIRTRTNPIEGCPLTAAMSAIGGKWKIVILYWLSKSPMHFAMIQRKTGGISHKVLTQQLSELVADGILRRDATGSVPSPVVYSLTDHGALLKPLLQELLLWGRTRLEHRETA